MRIGSGPLRVVAILTVFLAAIVVISAAYFAVVGSLARTVRIENLRTRAFSVRNELVAQDAGIRDFVGASDPAALKAYLDARTTFDADLAGLGDGLPALETPALDTPFADLRKAYRVWLQSVARPLVYTSPSRARAAALVTLGRVFMDLMRLDLGAIQSGIDAAALAERQRMERIVLTAGAVVAALAAFLAVVALGIERYRRLVESELRRFYDTVEDLLCVVSFGGKFLRTNQAWQRTLGYTPRDLAGRSFVDLVHPDDRGTTAYEMYRLARNEPVLGFRNRYRAKDGSYHWLLWNAVPDTTDRQVYVSARDETDRVRAESELEELSIADHLTGLPNRRHFVQQLQRSINMARRHGLNFWVLYLDLDGFKDINDRAGHAAGDDALKGIATNISSKLRESDLFARVGGDEFAILTPPIAFPRDVDAMAQKIIAAAIAPVRVADQVMELGVSLGIAGFPEDGITASELMAAADSAMYVAKRAGGSTYSQFRGGLEVSPPSA